MKKNLLLLLSLIMAVGTAFSAPIDVKTAKTLGQRFVRNNFSFGRSEGELSLAYTASTKRGEACFYVFNVGNEGFVIMSGNDAARPVLAYSDESAIDMGNISPELAYYLQMYEETISCMIENSDVATEKVEAEWNSLRTNGSVISRNGGRQATYLLTTLWNQDNYYNNLCPTASQGTASNGHLYAGCVACAMAQVYKYWNWPLQGQGQHSDHQYGSSTTGATYTVNFGNAIYDWENMPNKLSSSSSTIEVNAVATLMYHAGVAVDMQYYTDGYGSGAQTTTVPSRSIEYFDYSSAADYDYMCGNYYCMTLQSTAAQQAQWLALLKNHIDKGWPLLFSGYDKNGQQGHAWVCDGYDDYDYFHFNYGWGGVGNGFFSPYTMIGRTSPGQTDYDVWQKGIGAVCNLVPPHVYNNTMEAPSNFTATANSCEAKVELSWFNPSTTLGNNHPSTLSQIVVERDGQIVFTQNNVTAGSLMTWTDNNVSYSVHKYKVYAINENQHGEVATQTATTSPTTSYTVSVQSSSNKGLNFGYIAVVDKAENVVARFSSTSSNETSILQLPIGLLSFEYMAPAEEITITVTVKDQTSAVLYEYQGSSMDMPAQFLTIDNVATTSTIATPEIIGVTINQNNVTITWQPVSGNVCGYNIYDNGVLIASTDGETSYNYTENGQGGHCYTIAAVSSTTISEVSEERCLSVNAENCCPATDLYHEITSNNKIKLHWTKPTCSNFTGNKCGYYIYRQEGNGPWTYVMKSATTTSYTDNSVQPMNTYHYKVIAVYGNGTEDECIAMPANDKYNPNHFQIDVDLTDGIAETNGEICVYPNPTSQTAMIKGNDIVEINVFNILGQRQNISIESDNSIDVSQFAKGLYFVEVETADRSKTTLKLMVK